jgi:hypothetical protein
MKILIAAAAVVVAVVAVSAAVGAMTLGSDDKSPNAAPTSPAAPTTTVKRGKARIMPVGRLGMVLKGSSFVPGENVRVTISEAGPQKTRRVKADRLGAFLVRFKGGYDRCGGMTVTAVGDRGSKTGFQLSNVMCAAPGTSQ